MSSLSRFIISEDFRVTLLTPNRSAVYCSFNVFHWHRNDISACIASEFGGNLFEGSADDKEIFQLAAYSQSETSVDRSQHRSNSTMRCTVLRSLELLCIEQRALQLSDRHESSAGSCTVPTSIFTYRNACCDDAGICSHVITSGKFCWRIFSIIRTLLLNKGVFSNRSNALHWYQQDASACIRMAEAFTDLKRGAWSARKTYSRTRLKSDRGPTGWLSIVLSMQQDAIRSLWVDHPTDFSCTLSFDALLRSNGQHCLSL